MLWVVWGVPCQFQKKTAPHPPHPLPDRRLVGAYYYMFWIAFCLVCVVSICFGVFRFALHCVAWLCFVLGSCALFCVVLCCVGLFWIVLECVGLFWLVFTCVELLWVVLVCFGVLWFVLVCSGLLWFCFGWCRGVLGCSGMCCVVLDCFGVLSPERRNVSACLLHSSSCFSSFLLRNHFLNWKLHWNSIHFNFGFKSKNICFFDCRGDPCQFSEEFVFSSSPCRPWNRERI